MADYRRGYYSLVSAVEGMSDGDINDTVRFFWLEGGPTWTSIAGNSYEHVEEHVELIQRWLEQGDHHGS
jgi:hypothetical protein